MNKMNYEMFKEVVSEHFIGYLPEEYRGLHVCIHPVQKINRVLDGLSLVDNDGIGATFSVGDNTKGSPTIYVNDLYGAYLEGLPLTLVMINAAKDMVKTINMVTTKKINLNITLNESIVKDNVIFQLINTAQNKDMLANIPHREFLDLSIIYYWVMKVDENRIQSTVIKNDLAEKIGMNEQQLYTAAVNNTQRILPPLVKSLNDTIKETLQTEGIPAEMVETMVEMLPGDTRMQLWVITNSKNVNGAISMLYEDKLHELAVKLDSDLYILPSSVHEVIAISTSMGDPNEFAKMVEEINMNAVELGERLSNQVYHYSKDLRIITLATAVQNERLDNCSDFYYWV